MKITSFVTVLLVAGWSRALTHEDTIDSLLPRARPNSPKGYTPSRVDCPSTPPVVRSASSLSSQENAWLQRRRPYTIAAMHALLEKIGIPGFDAGAYLDDHSYDPSTLPNIGIAMSGGGWRALQSGAGALQAFDNRTNSGKLAGLLQSSTYLAGLSGGSWLVGSLFMNNFTTVTALRDEPTGDVWQFDQSVFVGPDTGGIQAFDTLEYWTDLFEKVRGKEKAGFEITITDIWGRALSYQLINAADGGPAYTWSSIALTPNFQNADTPFPVIIADTRDPGETAIPRYDAQPLFVELRINCRSNTTIYEFNPFEMGTWDPTAFGFVPTKYLGTNFTAGSVPSGDDCIIGFDNAGFLMGTSSSLFNQLILQVNSTTLSKSVKHLLNDFINSLNLGNEDIADYRPNPFYQYNPSSNPGAQARTLHLVDGGEDNQNIPFHPLIQPARSVDVIFAVDASADTTHHWPNGSALVNTYRRNLPSVAISNGTRFASIPDENTMINLGLNNRPTFFGCNASNVTDSAGNPVPLIVYIPNAPYATFSNVSTLTFNYNDSFRDAIILNGYDVATMANGTLEPDWPICVGCAILSRSLDRTGTTVPTACAQCFDKFCWNGTLNSTTPLEYNPHMKLKQIKLWEDTKSTSTSTASKVDMRGSIWGSLAFLTVFVTAFLI